MARLMRWHAIAARHRRMLLTASFIPRYTLEQLKKRARIAVYDEHLVQLAKEFLPSSVIEQAKGLRYKDYECRSVRFLAMIRRDYGEETFKRVVSDILREREERLLDSRESDAVVWEMEAIADDILVIDGELDNLATLDPDLLAEGFARLPENRSVGVILGKLAGLQAKLRGIEVYATPTKH